MSDVCYLLYSLVTKQDNGDGSGSYFLGIVPFGTKHGDTSLSDVDDESSQQVLLDNDVVLFGSIQKQLFVRIYNYI